LDRREEPAGEGLKAEAILDAAAAEMAAKGYHLATVKEIAARAGVATGTVYVYFPNKESLCHALVDRLVEKVIVAVIAERQHVTSLLDKLKVSLSVFARVFTEEKDLAKVLLIQAPGAGPGFDRHLALVNDRFAAFIRQDLEDAMDEGLIPPMDTEVASYAWVGTFNSVMSKWLRSDGELPLERTIPALISYNLRGIGAPVDGLRPRAPGRP